MHSLYYLESQGLISNLRQLRDEDVLQDFFERVATYVMLFLFYFINAMK